MKEQTVYDIIGIGIGPFNLGLAALTEPIEELNCLFIDQNENFNWHAGMMLDNARLQVPFYSDLVTLADPCSKFSYLNFLKAKGRMFRFAIIDEPFILRSEYNEYCRWVASQISYLRFDVRCEAVQYNESNKIYTVYCRGKGSSLAVAYYCKHIILGVGTVPNVQDNFYDLVEGKGMVFHSSDYLFKKEELLKLKSIAIIGSGQSAAEIFYDLLSRCDTINLKWYTSASEFFPMDYSALALEKTSVEYINYFFGLEGQRRQRKLEGDARLYKGINFSLIQDIYRAMYCQSVVKQKGNFSLHPNARLKRIVTSNSGFDLHFFHNELDRDFGDYVDAVILATGYKSETPEFLTEVSGLKPDTYGGYKVNRNYSIDDNNSIFVQNAELHSHGFSAPDLAMGPYRNSVIINEIVGREMYSIEKGIAFQKWHVS